MSLRPAGLLAGLTRLAGLGIGPHAGESLRSCAQLIEVAATDREVEVLGLVADGCSNAQIAERLVSRRTAEHHMSSRDR